MEKTKGSGRPEKSSTRPRTKAPRSPKYLELKLQTMDLELEKKAARRRFHGIDLQGGNGVPPLIPRKRRDAASTFRPGLVPRARTRKIHISEGFEGIRARRDQYPHTFFTKLILDPSRQHALHENFAFRSSSHTLFLVPQNGHPSPLIVCKHNLERMDLFPGEGLAPLFPQSCASRRRVWHYIYDI